MRAKPSARSVVTTDSAIGLLDLSAYTGPASLHNPVSLGGTMPARCTLTRRCQRRFVSRGTSARRPAPPVRPLLWASAAPSMLAVTRTGRVNSSPRLRRAVLARTISSGGTRGTGATPLRRLDRVEQQLQAAPSDSIEVLADGRQRRGEVRSLGDVVESDDADFARESRGPPRAARAGRRAPSGRWRRRSRVTSGSAAEAAAQRRSRRARSSRPISGRPAIGAGCLERRAPARRDAAEPRENRAVRRCATRSRGRGRADAGLRRPRPRTGRPRRPAPRLTAPPRPPPAGCRWGR